MKNYRTKDGHVVKATAEIAALNDYVETDEAAPVPFEKTKEGIAAKADQKKRELYAELITKLLQVRRLAGMSFEDITTAALEASESHDNIQDASNAVVNKLSEVQ